MGDEQSEFNEEEKSQAAIDWKNRTLCNDESCIGVIGRDGRCKECGKSYADPPPEESSHTDSSSEIEDEANDEESQTDLDWENRTLCRDGSCIGVIGPDGRCKECGKPYKG